jgi:hypothetical protein
MRIGTSQHRRRSRGGHRYSSVERPPEGSSRLCLVDEVILPRTSSYAKEGWQLSRVRPDRVLLVLIYIKKLVRLRLIGPNGHKSSHMVPPKTIMCVAHILHTTYQRKIVCVVQILHHIFYIT